MEKKNLEYGIKKYGTPLYIFDLDEMENHIAMFRRLLGETAGLCFAIKANPFLVKPMASVTDRLEVCSMGEFEICRELNIEAKKVLISGVLKETKDILEILNHYRGNCTYTVESCNQLKLFMEWSKKQKETLTVYLRLTSGNQFGMDRDEILEILSREKNNPYLKIQGIHFFSGTQKKSMKKVKQELETLDEFIEQIERNYHFEVSDLEYGPGIPVRYFEGQEDRMEEDIREIVDAIQQMRWKGRVVLEMGRALAASCGYYLTAVKDLKSNCGKNYCIVDGGIHHLNYDGQIRGMYCPRIQVCGQSEYRGEKEYTVCGSLCTVNDILMQKVFLPEAEIGDALVFEKTGAYAMTEGMSLFLSHNLPKVALYSEKNGWKLIRDDVATYQWNMEKETEYGNFN